MIQVSDSEDELDKSSGIYTSRFIVASITSDLEEEEEEILLERKKGLHELLMGKAKGSTPKDASESQLPASPLPPPSVNPFTLANLKKRKKDKEVVEKGELVPYNEEVPPKFPKTANKGRASLAKSKEDRHMTEMRPSSPTWNPQLELDGAAIPWNSTIREFKRGNTHYLANALEQPLLLPKDMAALKNVRQ